MKENPDGTLVEWNVGEPNENVDDIEIIVFDDEDMKKPRKYENQYRWEEEWTKAQYKTSEDRPQKYKNFIEKWRSSVAKRQVPIWYNFDPVNTESNSQAHIGSMKKIEEWKVMYDFLKKEKWLERDAEQTGDKRNKYTEKSQFVVDCEQLLGIGGEAVVIRKKVTEKVVKDKDDTDRDYEALKIIPMMKHNFESEKLEELKQRVEDRHNKADPEFNQARIEREERRKLIQSESQNRKG